MAEISKAEIEQLVKQIVSNLENNSNLPELAKRILIDGDQIMFNQLNPEIGLGVTYGILKKG